MLTPSRALTLSSEAGRPLPHVPALSALYQAGTQPRFGEVTMVAGRSGSQKSGFALWYVEQIGLPTLYFSADMSPFTASSRVASTRTGMTLEEVEAALDSEDRDLRNELMVETRRSQTKFAFGQPITGYQIDRELDAWVELYDEWPSVIVIDNLMDCDGADSEYVAQMAWMTDIISMARETEAAVIVMHHASDKSWDARNAPFTPPSRQEIKNGLSEKPALTLSVALDPNTFDFHIATLKQRSGPSDATGRKFVTITCEPERTRFYPRKRLYN